jgi:hypothetical protein
MQLSLPNSSTPESKRLFALAGRVAAMCPQALGDEIAVTGSVSHGHADEHSDLEIVVWNTRQLTLDQRYSWLESIGATQLFTMPNTTLDGTEWTTCAYEGRWIEFGWGTTAGVNAVLEPLLRAERFGSGSLSIAATLTAALPWRTSGQLAAWQRQLATYPDALQRKVIEDNTSVWSDPHVPAVRWALAARHEFFPLALRLTWDMQNLWAVLFASNRRWEPDLKWTSQRVLDLPRSPDNLSQRVNSIFTLKEPARCVREAYELVLEALALVPSSIDVASARRSIETALRTAPG